MKTLPYRNILLIALCGSGFSALVFEVLWTKHLSLLFGSTIWAMGLVVATFMGGLALGGALFGRLADRVRNPLRLYALLELGIALSAILFRPALQVVKYGYVALHGQATVSPTLATLLLLGFSALLLLPPTLCMGGTLPVVGRLLSRKDFSREISRLYAINVVGAAAGAFLAGYALIPFWGLFRTELFAYGINLGIALGFFCLSRRPPDGPEPVVPESAPTPAPTFAPILAGTFLAGGCALALQLLWNRVMVLFLGSSTYAFASILCVYLISMAVGGALFVPLQKRWRDLPALFAGLAVLSGLYVLGTLPFYDRIPYALLTVNQMSGQSWWLYVLAAMPVVFLVIGPPALLSGTMFPAAMAIYSPDAQSVGGRVGKIVLYNTLGAVLGSLVGAFWIVPAIGLQNGFKLTAALLLLLGTVAAICYGRALAGSTRYWLGGAVVVALVLICLPLRWDAKLMNSGVYYYYVSEEDPKVAFQGRLARQQLLESIEGPDATVAVMEDTASGFRYFTVNGKVDGGTRDMATQILLGQLPILIHPDPREVLVVGLGTGVTLGTVAQYPARKIDCVEISPAVMKAESYFREVNLNPRADSRVTTYVQDARNFLLLHPGKYDVVISEPSNPWQAGNANLFTLEFFQVVREHLHQGGVFCQWIPLYDLSQENLGVLLRTFGEVFPGVHLFINGPDLFMVGSADEIGMHYQGIKSRLARYFQGPLSAADTPADLLARHYLFSGKTVAAFARDAALNTDLFPILEYSGRYNLADQLLRMRRADLNRMDLYGVIEREKQTLPLAGLGNSPEEKDQAVREILESFDREKRGAMSLR